jgi:hypothetical protein
MNKPIERHHWIARARTQAKLARAFYAQAGSGGIITTGQQSTVTSAGVAPPP